MTRERALDELRAAASTRDIETAHVMADHILCDLLSSLGYEDVVAAYAAINKWYA